MDLESALLGSRWAQPQPSRRPPGREAAPQRPPSRRPPPPTLQAVPTPRVFASSTPNWTSSYDPSSSRDSGDNALNCRCSRSGVRVLPPRGLPVNSHQVTLVVGGCDPSSPSEVERNAGGLSRARHSNPAIPSPARPMANIASLKGSGRRDSRPQVPSKSFDSATGWDSPVAKCDQLPASCDRVELSCRQSAVTPPSHSRCRVHLFARSRAQMVGGESNDPAAPEGSD